MKIRFAALSLCLAAAAAAGCGPKESEPVNAESMAIDGLDDDTEASESAFDASELALGGPALAFGGNAGGSCTGAVTGSDEIAVCSRTVPGTRTVTWSCTGANGNGVSGTATVVTTVVDDTDCPNVAIRHDVTFARTRTFADVVAELSGTAQVDLVLDSANRTAERTIVLDVDREVRRGENVVRDQGLTGTRVADIALNGAGPADDTRTVNGNLAIEFRLRGSQLDIGATDLLRTRACCHPVGGRIDWVLSGTDEGSGSLRFGPVCGEALRADDTPVTLRPCPIFD